eukprot:scaffold37757_cov331-Isochrysis_galbana.AAC.1
MSASLPASLRADYGGALTRGVAIFGRVDQHSAGAEGAPYRLMRSDLLQGFHPEKGGVEGGALGCSESVPVNQRRFWCSPPALRQQVRRRRAWSLDGSMSEISICVAQRE